MSKRYMDSNQGNYTNQNGQNSYQQNFYQNNPNGNNNYNGGGYPPLNQPNRKPKKKKSKTRRILLFILADTHSFASGRRIVHRRKVWKIKYKIS